MLESSAVRLVGGTGHRPAGGTPAWEASGSRKSGVFLLSQRWGAWEAAQVAAAVSGDRCPGAGPGGRGLCGMLGESVHAASHVWGHQGVFRGVGGCRFLGRVWGPPPCSPPGPPPLAPLLSLLQVPRGCRARPASATDTLTSCCWGPAPCTAHSSSLSCSDPVPGAPGSWGWGRGWGDRGPGGGQCRGSGGAVGTKPAVMVTVTGSGQLWCCSGGLW